MNIRRLQYQIDYTHILTFKDDYKSAVTPLFPFDGVSYGIENEGLMDETIRIILKTERIIIFLSKQSLILVYEGDVSELKAQNGPISMFFDLYERVKKLPNFTRGSRHVLLLNAVHLTDKEYINNELENPSIFAFNPYGKMQDYSCTYEFKEAEIFYKISIGNYSEADIKKHDLCPFKSDYNKDLFNSLGLMARVEVVENEKNVSFSKFKHIVTKAEDKINHLKFYES